MRTRRWSRRSWTPTRRCARSTLGSTRLRADARYRPRTGLYADHVLPRLINVACATRASEQLRRRACDGLHGSVVEIGFGSGLSVPCYPAAVSEVVAIEPSDVAWKLAQDRVRASSIPVRRAGLDGQSLPLDDDSCDSALSAWTMCTIPDIGAALGELRRVLRPGGTVHFIEHGLAPDDGVQRWQRRLEPLQKRLVGGCHLTRQIPELLRDAGFVVDEVEVFYEKSVPKILGADSLGVATSPT